MTEKSDTSERNAVYVPADKRAHVFQHDGWVEWDTTVIAFKLFLDHDLWPIPILLDSTPGDEIGFDVYVEDQGKWTCIGIHTAESLDDARDFVKSHLGQ